ncbi:MAG: hypothetical protein ACE5GE_07370, partial [Phycisphaerae bacterium]
MAIPTQRLYDGDKLNVWFALSSIFMLAAILWMAYVDYARPWHAYQDQYMATQSTLAHLDYVRARRDSARQEQAQARAALEKARQQVATEDARRQALAGKLAQAREDLQAGTAQVQQARQALESAREQYERAKADSGPGDALTRRLEAKRAAAQAALEAALAAQRQAEQAVESARAEVEANPTLAVLHQRLAELDAEFDAVKIDFSTADAIIKVTASQYEHDLSEYGADNHH